jgi:hypothetical protein
MKLNILSTSKSNIGNFYLIIGAIVGLLGYIILSLTDVINTDTNSYLYSGWLS